MTNEPIIIERTFNAPADKVWKALTNIDEIRQWYFKLDEFRAEKGFEFEFEGGPDDRKYLHKCRITEVVPGKKLQYSWRYEGYEGNSFVTFELTPEGNKTRLTLTHEGLETFPMSNKDFDKKNFIQGWTQIIGTSLKDFVEKVSV
jgi:uncharacterized protein YndB with AHSA1/START domain